MQLPIPTFFLSVWDLLEVAEQALGSAWLMNALVFRDIQHHVVAGSQVDLNLHSNY